MPFGPTYDIINTLARWALNGYYSRIVITNPQEVPPTGPVIVAANHWNMTIDPAMLSTRMPHGRRLHYWAKNTLFKNPIINFVLLDAGNIPVDRTTRNNQLLFKGTFDVLKLGECVALFPEGTSYTQPKIMQVKDGIAWTALEYAKNLRLTGSELSGSMGTANGETMATGAVEDVKVIVCGLNYTDKTAYRASVQVEYSPAITLDQAIVDRFMTPGQEKFAVKELIRTIEARLRSVTVNADDWETLWAARILRSFIWSDAVGPLHNYRDNMQQLVNIMSLKEDSPTSLKNLRADLVEYHQQLAGVEASHLLFSGLAMVPVYVGIIARMILREQEGRDWVRVIVGLLVGLATVIVVHVVHDGMVDGAYGAWLRLRTCWRVKEERLDELWDLRERCLEGWTALQADLRAAQNPAFLKLITAAGPVEPAISRLQTPIISVNVDGLLRDPPRDSDPLLPDEIADEKSLLRGKKTL